MQEEQTKVLVTGATGAQGSRMLAAARARGLEAIGLARDSAEAEAIGATGAKARIGNLDDAASLERALGDLDALALVLPLEFDSERALTQGKNVIAAAQRCGVRVVFNTSTRFPDVATDVPAFEVKREIVRILARSGCPHVVVRPTFYFENLLGPWTLPGIVNNGVLAYPIPASLAACWVSHHDVAAVIAAVLSGPISAFDGTVLDVGGSERTTGVDLAAAISTTLGKPVQFTPIAAADFEAALAAAVGAGSASGIAALYRWIDANPQTSLFAADPSVFSRLELQPTPLLSWAAQQVWSVTP